MGGGSWSTSSYSRSSADRRAKGVDDFAYNKKVETGAASDIHPLVDPRRGGKRESRDVDGTRVTPITIALDTTGSGGRNPYIVQADLPQLMGLLSVQGYVKHPNVQVMSFEDARAGDYPVLQVSQFEADNKIDEALRSLVISHGGGGGNQESYELMLWYAAHMNDLDVWKRNERGFLFIVGDELPYREIRASEVAQHIIGDAVFHATLKRKADEAQTLLTDTASAGMDWINRPTPTSLALDADMPLASVWTEVKRKYDVYYIVCAGSAHFEDAAVLSPWKERLDPQHLIKLPDANDISEMIAATVGYQSGIPMDKIHADLEIMGTLTPGGAVTTALAALAGSGITPARGGSDRVTRL